MSEFADPLQRALTRHVDSVYEAFDAIAGKIDAAGALLGCSLLDGGKVCVHGLGPCSALSQLLCTALLRSDRLERPALPALCLDLMARAAGLHETEPTASSVASILRALGTPGDVLLLLAGGPGIPQVQALIDAAHGREMQVVLIQARSPTGAIATLRDDDVVLAVPAADTARALECIHVILNALVEQIEAQLFGSD